jgi:hypothetical protein
VWEESRENVGCSIAALMALSGFACIRILFIRAMFQTERNAILKFLETTPVMIAFAIVFVVFAFFAMTLKRWAIRGYFVFSLLAILFAFSRHLGWTVVVPLLIGMSAITVILVGKRDLI